MMGPQTQLNGHEQDSGDRSRQPGVSCLTLVFGAGLEPLISACSHEKRAKA